MIYAKVSTAYKEIIGAWTKVSGTWKEVEGILTRVSGAWKQGLNVPFYIFTADEGDNIHRLNPSGVKISGVVSSNKVRAIAVSPDCKVYTGDFDKYVRILDFSLTSINYHQQHSWVINAVAVDDDGYVYSADDDGVLKKYDFGNDEVIYSYRADANGEPFYGLAVDDSGYAYVGGKNNEIHKVSSSGSKVWGYGKFPTSVYGVHGIAVDKDDNVYGAGYTEVHKISSTGGKLWAYAPGRDLVMAVALDKSGNVYSGATYGGSYETLHKTDNSGTNVWEYAGDGKNDNFYAVATDPDGNVYATGDSVYKISASGSKIWEYTGHSYSVRGLAVYPGLLGAFPTEW